MKKSEPKQTTAHQEQEDRTEHLDLSRMRSVVFPNLDRPPRTIQIEHRFITSSDHMDVRRPMIVWVDDCPQSFKS